MRVFDVSRSTAWGRYQQGEFWAIWFENDFWYLVIVFKLVSFPSPYEFEYWGVEAVPEVGWSERFYGRE